MQRFAILALVALSSTTVSAPVPASGRHDVVFLGPARPVLIRFQVDLDGQPLAAVHRAARGRHLDAQFRHLDRNGNGSLDETEARNLPPPQFSLPGGGDGVNVAFNFRSLDVDGDNKVTRDELAEFLHHFEGGPFGVRLAPTAVPVAELLGMEMFRSLDVDGDGRLSKAELAASVVALRKYDQDDNDLLTPDEVMRGVFSRNPPGSVGRLDFVSLDETPGDQLARRLLERYGRRAGADELTAAQLPLERDPFAALDRNRDGKLSAAELADFADRAPDFEVRVRLGKRTDKAPLLELARPAGKAAGKDGLLLDAGARLELRADASWLTPRALAELRQRFEREFGAADRDRDGRLDRREADASRFYRGPFAAFDRDGDGKLTAAELKAALDGLVEPQAQALARRVTLLVSGEGVGIWELLDRDRDGVLGLREVRAAPALLAALDRDGNGVIDKSEMVPSYQLVVAPGQASFRRLSGETVVVVEPAGRLGYPPEQLGGGPSWFRKMDRNEDGELSPREFLGSPDDFKKLDLDGDGVLSRDEADAAEKLRRR